MSNNEIISITDIYLAIDIFNLGALGFQMNLDVLLEAQVGFRLRKALYMSLACTCGEFTRSERNSANLIA